MKLNQHMLIGHPARAADKPPPVALSPEQFSRLRDLLAEYSGVYLDVARQRVLEVGLARRMHTTGHALADYESRIRSCEGREELRLLAELVLNHETQFFRNGPHLRALQEVLFPQIHSAKPIGAPIRIWSAGCSTGEEAYSLAIVALETLGRPLPRPVEIYATDLSEPALRKARTGFYRGRTLNNLSPELLARYFEPRGDGYVVGEQLRSIVRFAPLNLLEPFPKYVQGVDMIFCQNVTIYFRLETCRELIARFYDCMSGDGLLFLGFSETLWNIFDGFHSREVAGAYVYYKGKFDSATQPAAESRPAAPAPPPANKGQRRASARPADAQPGSRRTHTQAAVSPNYLRSFDTHERPAHRPGQSDEAALRCGRELLEQGQVAEALEALRHISPQSACATQALTLAARAHADRDDLDLAVAEVQRALEIDTLHEEAYHLLGVIYARQGQWQAAVQQLERARYLSPASALVSFHLADAYRQVGRTDLSIREYRNTLRKLDHHPPGALLDGVAVGWLRETCQRQLDQANKT